MLETRLRVARAERRVTQEELARSVGVSRQTISSIENRSYSPSVKLALAIAECLDMDVNDLFQLVQPE